jgi:hypothetical protein
MSAATIASLVFFVCAFIASYAVEFLLWGIAKDAGVNPWVFVAVPALLAMLYAMFVYQGAERKISQLGQSVSRGILVMLLTWISIAATITWARCRPQDFGVCFGATLAASGVIGGGPMLLCAIVAGLVTGIFIMRKPKPRIL